MSSYREGGIHSSPNLTVTLRVDSWEDAELLAEAIRGSVFSDLTVKNFNKSEAADVLRLLWALREEGSPD